MYKKLRKGQSLSLSLKMIRRRLDQWIESLKSRDDRGGGHRVGIGQHQAEHNHNFS